MNLDVVRLPKSIGDPRLHAIWQDLDLFSRVTKGGRGGRRTCLPEALRVREAAGIGPMRFHDVRHSAATLLPAQGVPKAL